MRRHSADSRSADQKENDNHETSGAETEPQQAAARSGRAVQQPEKLR
jgi:hypothetical protein